MSGSALIGNDADPGKKVTSEHAMPRNRTSLPQGPPSARPDPWKRIVFDTKYIL